MAPAAIASSQLKAHQWLQSHLVRPWDTKAYCNRLCVSCNVSQQFDEALHFCAVGSPSPCHPCVTESPSEIQIFITIGPHWWRWAIYTADCSASLARAFWADWGTSISLHKRHIYRSSSTNCKSSLRHHAKALRDIMTSISIHVLTTLSRFLLLWQDEIMLLEALSINCWSKYLQDLKAVHMEMLSQAQVQKWWPVFKVMLQG